MATPQPMKPAPSQQGKTPQYAAATPVASASTPYSNLHAAFSPHGPKASPQQIKKSPANMGAGGVMMALNNSSSGHGSNGVTAPINFDSPSAAAFNSMLGMGTFDASLENMTMGVGGLALPRPSGDEERQKKLDEITHVLSQKNGIVSEEGLERLVKKCALDAVWQQARADLKLLTIAGATFAMDVGVSNHKVQTVELQYAFAGPSVTKHTAEAEAVLLDNLKLAPGQLPWTKELDDFANNLESLAALDKLCVIDEKKGAVLVTYDAIAGLYESLRKIHDYEVQQMQQDSTYADKPDAYVRAIATCERSGRPLIHEKGTVGLRLDYWRNQRYFNPSPAKTKRWDTEGKQWSILISCARRDPMVYSGAVRVSDEWIGDGIEVPATEGLMPMLNWQQPADIVLPEKPGDELLLAGPRTPEVMFMAIFDPPVALPITVWEQIHHYSGAPVTHASYMQTFDYLIFPVVGHYNPTEPRAIETRKYVNAKQKDGAFKQVTHDNRLFIHKPVYGQTLTELPFSHPSQLISMLPILRQYAFLWNLLDKSFGGQAQQRPVAKFTNGAGHVDNDSITLDAKSEEYTSFRNDDSTRRNKSDTRIDVTLNAHPQPNPKLQIMFHFQGRAAEVNVDIGANGLVTLESTNVVNDLGQVLDADGHPLPGSVPDQSRSKTRLARMLMFFENIDTWCEWIRVNISLD